MTELAVIIPTYKERENIEPLLKKLEQTLGGIAWEVIFVDDDSPDGTAAVVNEMAKDRHNVRCLHRIGRRGLSSASIEGMLATSAPYLAVMDADLQHDETLLLKMLETLKSDHLDLVVGSRYVDQGGMGSLSNKRVAMSRFATEIGKKILRIDVKDPMSGFFMLRRNFLNQVVRRLTGKGFKILLDIFTSADATVRFKELPYEFKSRQAGESKLGTLVMLEYLLLLADKTIGRFLPVRFILFVFVGMCGALVHLMMLGLALKIFNLSFLWSQTIATFVAMTLNFIFNNLFTYRDRQLHGTQFIHGLLSFYAACGLGALVNIQIAAFLYERGVVWWLAGLLGGGIGGVWNYAVTRSFTWTDTKL